jgi:hypothetical protein
MFGDTIESLNESEPIRPLIEEYVFGKEKGFSDNMQLQRLTESFYLSIVHSHNQIHFLTGDVIPLNELEKIAKSAELQSMEQNQDPNHYSPFMPLQILGSEDLKDIFSEKFYEQYFKALAGKIKFADRFQENERYQDMANWVLNHYDRFAHNSRNFYLNDAKIRKAQSFMDTYDGRFSTKLENFQNFFSPNGLTEIIPVTFIGKDVPAYDEKETKELIDRFYHAIKGYDKKTLHELDGEKGSEKFKKVCDNIDEYIVDENPEEIKKLANIASNCYHLELGFMFQGAPYNQAIVVPRWTISLMTEFGGNWHGAFHPLLKSGYNSQHYHEEAYYITHYRC